MSDTSRFSDPVPVGIVRDSKGRIIYPTDAKEKERAIAVERAWELDAKGDDSELRRLGIIE